jgi:hypothetical protein
MTATISRLHERFFRIERAYWTALAGRDPDTVEIIELVPAIFDAMPDTTLEEIADALRWSARKDVREADLLRKLPK